MLTDTQVFGEGLDKVSQRYVFLILFVYLEFDLCLDLQNL